MFKLPPRLPLLYLLLLLLFSFPHFFLPSSSSSAAFPPLFVACIIHAEKGGGGGGRKSDRRLHIYSSAFASFAKREKNDGPRKRRREAPFVRKRRIERGTSSSFSRMCVCASVDTPFADGHGRKFADFFPFSDCTNLWVFCPWDMEKEGVGFTRYQLANFAPCAQERRRLGDTRALGRFPLWGNVL